MIAPLFPEPAASAAPHIPRRSAVYIEAGARPTVRHLLGYEEFAAMCSATGADPAALAVDLVSLIAFVRERKEEITANGCQDAAAIFFGNVLVQQRHDADWMQFGDDFPSAGTERQRFEVSATLRHVIDADEETLRKGLAMLNDWIAYRPE
jgi:hypothetical protein